MGAKSMFVATANTVPTASDKFAFANAEDNNQIQSCRVSDLRSALGESVTLEVVDAATAVAIADDQCAFVVPAYMDGWELKEVIVGVKDKGITGTTDVMIHKETGGVAADMLSTEVTLGDEFSVADGVIDATEDDVATGDIVYVDVDAIHTGTAPNGLFVTLFFGL
jgi:hypothetical protein